jgi:hypothetical protein
MKHLLLFIGLIISNLLSAQDTLKLMLNRPAPRVGDEVELSFSLNFLTEDLKRQLNDEIELGNSPYAYSGIKDAFLKTIQFNSPGKHTIGPFQFNFNGKSIITDSIVVDVAQKLPFEKGVWVRVVSDADGKQYIIIEQLSRNLTNLAELKAIAEKGIEISYAASISSSRRRESEDKSGPKLSYSYKKYRIDFSDDFNEPFILKKEHFSNFPKKAEFKEIAVSK